MKKKQAATIVRSYKLKDNGMDFVSEDDCPAHCVHDWCYACMNDILEQIAKKIEE